MSKFVSSSIWNFVANFIIRIMSITTFPFLVKFYLKEDIAVFKSFQSYVLILMAIIPIGTNILYLSVSQEEREERWALFFYTSIVISLLMALSLLFIPRVTSFFIDDNVSLYVQILMAIVPLMEGWKIILVTKLSASMDFKEISIALIVKQLFLYSCIILFAYLKPILPLLLMTVFISELIELTMLFLNFSNKGFYLLPTKSISYKITDNTEKATLRIRWNRLKKRLKIDKVAKKYIGCSGVEQIFMNFAVQFPTVFVVIVLGKNLAPEFQLPFLAVTMPVSMVMNSIAKVSFPHFSNLREDERITLSLFSVLFPITFILFPIMAGINFFAAEISRLFLDVSWNYAIYSLQIFPVLMVIYILSIPSSYVSNIKGRPEINLVYAIALFIFRIAGIYFGFKIGGFIGTVVFFTLGDFILRIARLNIDIKLLQLSVSEYFNCIKYNLYSLLLLVVMAWSSYLTLKKVLIETPDFIVKIISFSLSFVIAMAVNYRWENERLKELIKKIRFPKPSIYEER